MSDFVDGIIFKLPPDSAPDYVKGKLSVNVPSFAKWVKENKPGDWINLDLKVSKDGKPYAILDVWKPDKNKTEIKDDGSNLPF